MIASKSILKYFESIEAGRGPPELKKKTFFMTRYYFSMKELKMNQPIQTTKQNFKAPPRSFESTRGPPELRKDTFSLQTSSCKPYSQPPIIPLPTNSTALARPLCESVECPAFRSALYQHPRQLTVHRRFLRVVSWLSSAKLFRR